LFAFYMTTDPKTTPASRPGQALFGAAVAGTDQLLRSLEILHAPFYALFLVSAARLAWSSLRLPRQEAQSASGPRAHAAARPKG
jgi:hypothetical protein